MRPAPSSIDYGTPRMEYEGFKNKYKNLLGRRFVIREDGAFAKRINNQGQREHPPGSEGTIVNVGGNNITYVMDDRPDKKRTFYVGTFFGYVDLLPEKK